MLLLLWVLELDRLVLSTDLIGIDHEVVGCRHLELELLVLHVQRGYLGKVRSHQLVAVGQLPLHRLGLVVHDLALVVALVLHH